MARTDPEDLEMDQGGGSPAAVKTLAPSRRTAFTLAAVAVLVVVSVVGFEIACRIYAAAVIFPGLEATTRDPLHFYRKSENEILAYELRPGFAIDHDGRRLEINRYGLRDSSDDLGEGRRRVALLGDSVLFAVGQSQENTISALLQQHLDPDGARVRVLNWGVPGYGFAEVAENMRVKNDVYDVSDAVYVLNLNDFSRRDSVYEGADNGLYRTYRRPTWMAPWFIGKAIYRYRKGGSQWGDARWYRWFFEGNEERGYAYLDQMIDLARREGIDFSVVLLPAGAGYVDGVYVLADLHRRIGDFLRDRGVRVLDPIDAFDDPTGRLIDETDHMHQPGLDLMAELVADFIREGDRARRPAG